MKYISNQTFNLPSTTLASTDRDTYQARLSVILKFDGLCCVLTLLLLSVVVVLLLILVLEFIVLTMFLLIIQVMVMVQAPTG